MAERKGINSKRLSYRESPIYMDIYWQMRPFQDLHGISPRRPNGIDSRQLPDFGIRLKTYYGVGYRIVDERINGSESTKVIGQEHLHLFDAIEPIVYTDFIDESKTWNQFRDAKGDRFPYGYILITLIYACSRAL